jgi:F0F1-type ATP synthase assembly protein I
MRISSAAKTTTNTEAVPKAKRAFFVSLFDLSWRLAAAVLAPLFIGLYIDSNMAGEGQGYALAGFALGMVAGIFVMRDVVRRIAAQGLGKGGDK